MIATVVPGSASAETNQRLCGAKVAAPNGTVLAYTVAKVQKDDAATCDTAALKNGPALLNQQLKTGGIPNPNGEELRSRNIFMATCEDVFADLGFPPGTDDCPGITQSTDSQNVFPVLISRPA